MKVSREIEMWVKTDRRFIIREQPLNTNVSCPVCNEQMIEVEQAAKLFELKQRQVFQMIEIGKVHFIETDTGKALVCLASMTNEANVNTLDLGTGK
ncbi:MAG: hypothetical protein QM785_01240 [Pyrinomonadaceae bacterium]